MMMPVKKKQSGQNDRTVFCLCGEGLFLHSYATLFDAGFLAGEGTQIVKFGTADFAVLVDCDRIDEGRFDGEDTFHADVVAHFANGETLLGAFSRNADYNTAVLLDTLLVTFFDTVGYCDGVAGGEVGVLLAGSESFFGNFNKIHCNNKL